MKNKSLSASIAAILALTLSYLPANSQESTQSASPSADLEIIKENVKRRIQEVVNIKGDTTSNQEPVAYMGILSSIANQTLTIEGTDGIKLASTSAITNFIALPDNDSIDFDELSLDNYIVALGYMDQSQVLDARRVIIEDEPLENPLVGSVYGITIPSDDDIVIQNPLTNLQFSCTSTRSTEYESIQNDRRTTIDEEDVLPLTPTMIVYEPDEDDPETLYCLNILQHSSAPAPNLDVNEASSTAKPAELP